MIQRIVAALLLLGLIAFGALSGPIQVRAVATFTVNSTADSGGSCIGTEVCPLRQAILMANSQPGSSINFNIPGDGVHTIMPATALPDILSSMTIDGYTQPGAKPNSAIDTDSAVALIEIDGAHTSGSDGLHIAATATGVEIRGLVINDFSYSTLNFAGGYGIRVSGNGNKLQGNFVGTNPAGTTSKPNNFGGILVEGAKDNLIGGTQPPDRNLISGNVSGIVDDNGITVTSFFNLTNQKSVPSDRTTIQGNFIGTDITGTVPLPNSRNGIILENSTNSLIGGKEPGARNVISGSQEHGVETDGLCPFDQQQQKQVCQTTAHVLQGNFIGTDATGRKPLGNGQEGVYMDYGSVGNVIGGADLAARNVISSNGDDNIAIRKTASHDNVVQGNYIGLDVSGMVALGGATAGIFIGDSANNKIGGSGTGEGNYISGNSQNGMLISRAGATGNLVQGNVIGENARGEPAGNILAGIRFHNGAKLNIIGGTGEGQGNTIAHNGTAGVVFFFGDSGPDPTQNSVLGNSILDNVGLGIDIDTKSHPAGDSFAAGDGVTPNDNKDVDAGPNDVQNLPVLTDLVPGASIQVNGSLNSTPNSQFTIELFGDSRCDPSGYGEGEAYLGSQTVNTDGSGNAAVSISTTAAWAFYTSTATSQNGSTSEFSACLRGGAVEGDADCNGPVEALDALAILINQIGLHSLGCPGLADVNCDHVVDQSDALLILRYLGRAGYVPVPGCTAIGVVRFPS